MNVAEIRHTLFQIRREIQIPPDHPDPAAIVDCWNDVEDFVVELEIRLEERERGSMYSIAESAIANPRSGEYIAVRSDDGSAVVTVKRNLKQTPLAMRTDLYPHSPTGFQWGYGGSGPAQLALALLADFLGDDQAALFFHQSLKEHLIASLPREGWILTGIDLARALEPIVTRRDRPEPQSYLESKPTDQLLRDLDTTMSIIMQESRVPHLSAQRYRQIQRAIRAVQI
jgi:hypothetical protein